MSFISCPLEIPQFLSLTDNFFSECQNYQSLIAADRKITYETYHTGIVTAASLKAGIVLKELRELDCLLHVRLQATGVVLTQRAGWQMDTLVWLMAESVSKSVSATMEIVVMLKLKTSAWGTAGITTYTNLFL